MFSFVLLSDTSGHSGCKTHLRIILGHEDKIRYLVPRLSATSESLLVLCPPAILGSETREIVALMLFQMRFV
jgi:hypothetical protein